VARILLDEPHPDVRQLMEVVVRRLGHEPVARSADDLRLDGIEAAIVEPASGGLALARRLREHDVPVVFTSIFPAEDETLALEPAAYLVKPFALHKLESALAAALRATVRV
jgi:DNA-binding response OmpR family regulator